jgi:hypothetical protein
LDAQICLIDRQVRPDMIKDLPPTHYLTSVPQQQRKNVEGTTSNVDGILPLKKKALGRDQTIRSELEYFTFVDPLLQGNDLSVHHCTSCRPSTFSIATRSTRAVSLLDDTSLVREDGDRAIVARRPKPHRRRSQLSAAYFALAFR